MSLSHFIGIALAGMFAGAKMLGFHDWEWKWVLVLLSLSM